VQVVLIEHPAGLQHNESVILAQVLAHQAVHNTRSPGHAGPILGDSWTDHQQRPHFNLEVVGCVARLILVAPA
jgi:hypothetical protein